jgi:hypothetical protein
MGAAVSNAFYNAQTGNPQQPGGPEGKRNRARFNERPFQYPQRVEGENGSAKQQSGGTTSIMLQLER